MTDKASANILLPIEVTDSMLLAGTTIPVVDASMGEVSWAVGTAYSIGQRVNYGDSRWEAVMASTGVTPGSDATKWLRVGPTNRMAPFDNELNTKAKALGSITYVINPGFFTGVALWGLQGDHLLVQILDEPGGAVVEEFDEDLYEQALGLYELLFMPLRQRTQVAIPNLPLYADGEVRITISSSGGGEVAVGLISVGSWDTLLGSSEFGGVQYGATAEVKTYSYIKRGEDGSVTRLRRGNSTNVECEVVIDAEQANHAIDLLFRVQGIPVFFIASNMPRYDYLSGFGDLSGSATAASFAHSILRIKIEGVVQ